MGFKQVELVPISSTGPSTNIPVNKDVLAKAFQVTRTDTGANILKCVLPADASITDIRVVGVTGSNAGTTAVINVGLLTAKDISPSGSTVAAGQTSIVNGMSVLGAAGTGRTYPTVNGAALMTPDAVPQTGIDWQITAQYAETGAASSAGGPWTVYVEYVR